MHMLANMMSAAAATIAPPGQLEFFTTQTWVVPAGISSLSAVCVQQGADASATGTQIEVGGVVVCRAKNGARIGAGGGDGGNGGPGGYNFDELEVVGGGGGAGGYNGNGGAGSYHNGTNLPSEAGAANSGAGSGGAGFGYYRNGPIYGGYGGGGVGLKGRGATGASSTGRGNPGSGGQLGGDVVNLRPTNPGGLYGGGLGHISAAGSKGGANSWQNDIAVTAGQVVTLTIPANAGVNGAIRLMWGPGRSYPDNAGDA